MCAGFDLPIHAGSNVCVISTTSHRQTEREHYTISATLNNSNKTEHFCRDRSYYCEGLEKKYCAI